MTLTTDIQTALTNFVEAAQSMMDTYYAKAFPNLPRTVLTVEPGRRYARIVRGHDRGDERLSSKSAYCFIDLTNGDILKPAGWKAPAKHARGSIFAADPLSAVNPYGANYLR